MNPLRSPKLVPLLLALLLLSFTLPACSQNSTLLPSNSASASNASTMLPGSTTPAGTISNQPESPSSTSFTGVDQTTFTPAPATQDNKPQNQNQASPYNNPSTTAAPPSSLTPVLAVAPTQALPAPTVSTPSDTLYIGETGHFIKGPFLTFWQKHGQTAVFGNPLSETYAQNGLQVQLFEQALLEYHPELAGQDGEIQLGFLGRKLAQAEQLDTTNPAFAPVAEKAVNPNDSFISETGHTLAEPFKSFWFDNGLVKFLGYPISQPFDRDGQSVQYFERGRLEYNSATKAVNYSNSGDLLIAAEGWPPPQKFNLRTNLPETLLTRQGQTLLVQLSNPQGWQPADLQGKFATSTLKFAWIKPDGSAIPVWRAYQAVDPALAPQTYPLILTFTDKSGVARTITRSIQVAVHDYGTQDLTLVGSLDTLADHQADDYDNTQLAGAYSTFTPNLLWKGLWQWPLQVPWTQTTDFAQRRVFNGKLDTLYYHGGIDLAPNSGADGANVHTGAAGMVIYTGSLQARGLSVAVDHGLGVTSYYFHLSQINVKVGQTLQAGEVVGLVGSTGRATGPHLDWEVRVNGIITDPRNFLQFDYSN